MTFPVHAYANSASASLAGSSYLPSLMASLCDMWTSRALYPVNQREVVEMKGRSTGMAGGLQ